MKLEVHFARGNRLDASLLRQVVELRPRTQVVVVRDSQRRRVVLDGILNQIFGRRKRILVRQIGMGVKAD